MYDIVFFRKDHAKLPGIGAFKMSLVFLRRKSRILLLIGIAGSLFLCFQLFSFKVLSFSNKQQHDNHRMARILDEELEAEFEQERHGARVQKGQLDGIKLDNEKALNQDKKNGEELKVHHSIFNNDKEKPGTDLKIFVYIFYILCVCLGVIKLLF